ncbi:hypothetical protein F4806DRAFT_477233 [Annulohypoxylon nitens]|nr:hypothetical protein F4806DRAFT_477233 [Annulohypoxylon nitens]
MAPRANKAEDVSMTLSQRDVKIIAIAWCCIKSVSHGRPVIDYSKFTAAAGYKTQDSARHSLPPLERKLMSIAASYGVRPSEPFASSGADTPIPSRPSTSTPKSWRKRKLPEINEDEDGDVDTPTKPRAKRLTARNSLVQTRKADASLKREDASIKREPKGEGKKKKKEEEEEEEEGKGGGGEDESWDEFADFLRDDRDGEA